MLPPTPRDDYTPGMEPTRLGPYTIRRRLGRGGMGSVYEAEDATSGQVVAVKTLAAHLGDDTTLRRRFTSEIDALKALRHPGIVRLLAFGEEDDQPYFAMELVPGRSLEQLLRSGRRFDWRETVSVALEVARALKIAHDQGIIHRDLKPANLLFLDPPGEGVRVKLADFGIARLFGDSSQTMAGTIVGTVEYMAPEQAAGRPVDHRADLYSLGLVMFSMLTGAPPFRGGQATQLLVRQQREIPPRISSLVKGVPRELDEFLHKLLAKSPDDRPASALAVGRVLSAIEALGDVTPTAAGGRTVADASVTAHGEGDRGTIAAGPVPSPPPQIDLFASTQAMTVDGPAAIVPDGATGPFVSAEALTKARAEVTAGSGGIAHRPTEGGGDGERGPAPPRRHFTTIEEVHRAAQESEARAARLAGLWQALAAALTLALLLGGGWLLLRPETADELHARIVAVTSIPDGDRRDARPFVERFLARFPDDPRADDVRSLERTLALDALERRARRRPSTKAVLAPIERDYRAAMDREPESPSACLAALEALLAMHAEAGTPATADGDDVDPSLWLDLVRRQIERVGPLAATEREEDVARTAATLAEAAALDEQAAAADEEARGPLLARRKQLLDGLVELYGDRPHVAAAVAEARRLLAPPPSTP